MSSCCSERTGNAAGRGQRLLLGEDTACCIERTTMLPGEDRRCYLKCKCKGNAGVVPDPATVWGIGSNVTVGDFTVVPNGSPPPPHYHTHRFLETRQTLIFEPSSKDFED